MRLALRAALLTAVGCSPLSVDLTERPCDAGACHTGFVCHPEHDLCVPPLQIGCSGAAGTVCPAELRTGDVCSEPGTFVSCNPTLAGCDGGCRTCGDDLTWSPCSAGECVIGNIDTCSNCSDNCQAEVIGAVAICLADESGFGCNYVGECQGSYVDLDGIPGNGCECPVSDEICDGLDNDCSGEADEQEALPCGPGETCEAQTCVSCSDDDPLHCGEACDVCDAQTPQCAAGACTCTASSCPLDAVCEGGACVTCSDNDPLHCGATCAVCATTTPMCLDGGCICQGASCGAAFCLPSGVCAPVTGFGSVQASPHRVAADGTSVATVVVEVLDGLGAPRVGRSVRVFSDRSGDVVTPPLAVTDALGQVTVTVASAIGGVSLLRAVDLDTPEVIADDDQVAFLTTADLAGDCPFDAPSGVPLPGSDSSGDLLGLWTLNSSSNETLVGEGPSPALPLPASDDFADGLVGSAWGGRCYVANTGSTVLASPCVNADGGHAVGVTYPATGGVELAVTSPGGAAGPAYSVAQIERAGGPHGAYDLRLDYDITYAGASTANYHVPIRLLVVFGVGQWVYVEIMRSNGALFANAAYIDGATVIGITAVETSATTGTLRAIRLGAEHRLSYLTAPGVFTDLLVVPAGLTTPVIQIAATPYVNVQFAEALAVTVSGFELISEPAVVYDGVFGGALDFDETDLVQYQDQLVSTMMVLTEAATFETWFRSSGGSSPLGRLLEVSTTGTTASNAISMALDGTLRGWLDCSIGGLDDRFTTLSSTQSYDDGRWHHAALAFSGSSARLYVDGVVRSLDAAADCTNIDNGEFLALGGAFGSGADRFLGQLDHPAVYDIDLGDAEIAIHHLRGRVLNVVDGSLGDLVGAASVAGVLAEALRFVEPTDYVAAPLSTIGGVGGGFTAGVWVRVLAPLETDQTGFVVGNPAPNGDGLTLSIAGSDGTVSAAVVSGLANASVDHPAPIDDGFWHHVAVTHESGSLCVAVDGDRACTATFVALNGGTWLYVGGDSSDRPDWQVEIDSLRWFSRALTPTELAAEAFSP